MWRGGSSLFQSQYKWVCLDDKEELVEVREGTT